MAFALAFAIVISYAPRVMLQIVASLTDGSRGVIYVYSTGVSLISLFHIGHW